jgi:hypothetical protein
MSSHENPVNSKRSLPTLFSASLLAAASLAILGCGTPGAPQPPSLNLPEPAADLTAVRAGTTLVLHWTMPKKTVDHLLIKAPVPVVLCWREASGPCQPDGSTSASPGMPAEFRAVLPANLASGAPRPVSFFVELNSPKGRSGGPSNAAVILAGQAPGPVAGLAIQTRPDGAALAWAANPSGSETTLVRLHRKLLTPPSPRAASGTTTGPLKPSPEPPLRDLFVTPEANSPSGALDKTARFGEEYEYTAQRVLQVSVNGKTMEIAGELSAPVRIQMIDTFPPTVPHGLVAVFVPEEKTIDLSWEPDSDPDIDQDLAGYIVYRAETNNSANGDSANGGSPADWKRVSPTQPIPGTSYRDAAVVPGHSYRYAVTAIDQTGHESNRSAAATESDPNP